MSHNEAVCYEGLERIVVSRLDHLKFAIRNFQTPNYSPETFKHLMKIIKQTEKLDELLRNTIVFHDEDAA